jgi:DNA processing protein
MYNQNSDKNNPMFDLNRKLINEDGRVVILTDKNLKKIITKIQNNNYRNYGQMSLFGDSV